LLLARGHRGGLLLPGFAMTNGGPPQDEASCLAALYADDQAIRARIGAFSTKPGHSPEEIKSLIADLSALSSRLYALGPSTSALAQAGRPAASQRLAGMIADLNG